MPTTKPRIELSKLFTDNGINTSVLPPIMTAEELALVLKTTTASLAQDRYRRVGVPYVKHGAKDSLPAC